MVEVETDKAIAEVAAPRDGVVTAIEVEVGDTIPVGATLLCGSATAPRTPAPRALDSEAAADHGGRHGRFLCG